MYNAKLVIGDFSDNTMTFEVEDEMILQAGDYVIQTKEEHESSVSKMSRALEILSKIKATLKKEWPEEEWKDFSWDVGFSQLEIDLNKNL